MTKKQAADLKMSLSRLNLMSIPIVDLDDRIVSGHMRCRTLAALGRGNEEIDVRVPNRKLTDDEFAEANLRENKNLGEWDEGLLATFDDSMLKEIGFDDADLESIFGLNRGGTAGLTDPDEVLEVPEEPVTRPGDLIVLGNHRLLCGDATKAEDVVQLMGDETAELCLTDPPYSVNYDKSQEQRGGNIKVHSAYKEADIDPEDLLRFMSLVPSDVMIWSYPIDRHFIALANAYAAYGWEFKKELVWVKDSFSFWMSAKYQQKHEPIMLAVRKGRPIGGNVPANATTVLEYPRPKAHAMHPTAKPIGLWSEFVTNHTEPGNLIYEPFSGSGTTIIAAEQLGRKCYGMEISPAYCDVIVHRWENFTGKKAERPVAVVV
jgi:DNA modification methylase